MNLRNPKYIASFGTAVVASVGLIACGGETTEQITNNYTSGMDIVGTVSELPKCTSENAGDQALVKSEGVVRYCVDGEWVSLSGNSVPDTVYVSGGDFSCTTENLADGSGVNIVCNGDVIGTVLNGKDGVAGANGKDGVAGADGKDGQDGTDGVGCSIVSSTDTTVTVKCGDGAFTMNINGGSVGVIVTDTTTIAELTGVSQKGPFVSGTQVIGFELDGTRSFAQTGRSFMGKISNDDGKFRISNVKLVSSQVLLSASGYYRNEVTGEKSSSELTLSAITNLGDRSNVNINLLTHLEYDRVVDKMMHGGGTLKIKTAKKETQQEIMNTVFGIENSNFRYSEDLDIAGETEGDAALLALSILLQGDRSVGDLTELLTAFGQDLETDGTWDDTVTRAEIADWLLRKDFEEQFAVYRNNVEGWHLSESVPAFEKYLRMFYSRELNIGECDANSTENSAWIVDNKKSKYNGFYVSCEEGKVKLSLRDSRDGIIYKIVHIGNQVWMAENLNYAYNNPTSTLDTSSFCYENSADSCAKYGRLYTWSAAMDSAGVVDPNGAGKGCGISDKECKIAENVKVRGVCPEGWHLPSEAEWNALFTTVGEMDVVGLKLKSTSGWDAEGITGNGDDSFGFSVLPAGLLNEDNEFKGVGSFSFFWSSTEFDEVDPEGKFSAAVRFLLGYASNGYYEADGEKNSGFSVRCLMD